MDSEERTAVLWFMQGSCMVSFYRYPEEKGTRRRNLGTENLVLADLSYRQICSLVIYEATLVYIAMANRIGMDTRDIENSTASNPTFDASHQAGVTKQSINDITSRAMATIRIGRAQRRQESNQMYPT